MKQPPASALGGPPREGPPTPPNVPGSDIDYFKAFMRHASVTVRGGELVMAIVSERPMIGIGRNLNLEAFFDTDQDIRTGYAIATVGADFVALVLEPAPDGRYPIVVGDREGSWSPITGYGTLDSTRKRLEFRIPLTALGGDDGATDWAVKMVANGSIVGAATGSSLPPGSLGHAVP